MSQFFSMLHNPQWESIKYFLQNMASTSKHHFYSRKFQSDFLSTPNSLCFSENPMKRKLYADCNWHLVDLSQSVLVKFTKLPRVLGRVVFPRAALFQKNLTWTKFEKKAKSFWHIFCMSFFSQLGDKLSINILTASS